MVLVPSPPSTTPSIHYPSSYHVLPNKLLRSISALHLYTLTMTFQQEAASWIFPSRLSTSPIPSIAVNAPSTSKLPLPNPNVNPTIITFLRHCGCPFAEKTFLSFRAAASAHPSINFVAVSHSDESATNRWLEAVGGADHVRIIVDSERELFARWGLGVSSFWHVLNPASMWSVYRLGKEQGIVSNELRIFFPSPWPHVRRRARCGSMSSSTESY